MEKFCESFKECTSCAIKACYWLAQKTACHYRPVNGSGIADRLLCAGQATTTTATAVETQVRATPLSLLGNFAEPSPLVQGLTEREIVLIILLAVISAVFLVVVVVLLLLKWSMCAHILHREMPSRDEERLIESTTDDSSLISQGPAHASTPLPRTTASNSSSTSPEEESEREPLRQQQRQQIVPQAGVRGTQTAYFTSSESSGHGDFEEVELTPPRVLRPRPLPTPQRFEP